MAKLILFTVEHFIVHGLVHIDGDLKIGELDLIGVPIFSDKPYLDWFFLHNLKF